MALPASAFEALASGIKAVFDAEFLSEGFTLQFDKPHDALGRDRVAAGVYPTEERANARTRIMAEHWLEVKLLGLWTDEISPDTIVNPFKITSYAERFKRALGAAQATDAGTGQVWFYDVDRIAYPDDPTGNKSRFIMTIRAFGNNTNLVETTS